MNRMFFIVATIVAVMLISSCTATTEKAVNTNNPTAITPTAKTESSASPEVTNTAPKPNNNRPKEQEIKVLQLLGRVQDVQSLANVDCKNTEKGTDIFLNFGKILKESLIGKDIATNLHETAKKIGADKECEILEIVVSVEKNPTLDQIKQILGSPDSNSPTKLKYMDSSGKEVSFPFYSYGWLNFRVENNNKVKLLLIDFAKSGV